MWYRALIRRLFHHFYREFAWTYDTVAWLVSGGLWQRWVLATTPFLEGRILEIGFGPGHLQLALAAHPLVAGLDASPQMAMLAARRLRRAGHIPRLARGLGQSIPFATAAFDTVVATFPAEYLLEPATQAEIRRVLAPGGRFVVLPFAQLLDPGLYTSLVELAYALTLQRPSRDGGPAGHDEEFRIGDFALKPHWLRVGPSRALVLVGAL